MADGLRFVGGANAGVGGVWLIRRILLGSVPGEIAGVSWSRSISRSFVLKLVI